MSLKCCVSWRALPASGLTIARIRRINLKIVWIVDETTAFFGEWDDLFSGPKLPLTTFPGGSTNHNESACPVHDITHREEFNPVFNKKWITYVCLSGTALSVLTALSVVLLVFESAVQTATSDVL